MHFADNNAGDFSLATASHENNPQDGIEDPLV
jgi:hypothetical protein